MIDNLAARDGGQELPQFTAVHEGLELSANGTVAQAPQHAQGNIFFIERPARRGTQPQASQLDKLMIVTLPQSARSIAVAE